MQTQVALTDYFHEEHSQRQSKSKRVNRVIKRLRSTNDGSDSDADDNKKVERRRRKHTKGTCAQMHSRRPVNIVKTLGAVESFYTAAVITRWRNG